MEVRVIISPYSVDSDFGTKVRRSQKLIDLYIFKIWTLFCACLLKFVRVAIIQMSRIKIYLNFCMFSCFLISLSSLLVHFMLPIIVYQFVSNLVFFCRLSVILLVMMGLPLVLKLLKLRHPLTDLFSL